MGLPGLDQPVMLHSSRMDMCKLTPEQCAYRNRKWLYWYKDDYYYGHGTVYFIVVLIALFAAAHIAHLVYQSPTIKPGKSIASSKLVSKPLALVRFFSYRSFAIKPLGWYSPALGVILIGCAAWVYFGILTLGPKPYYWPNTPTVNYGGSPPIASRAGFMALALLPFTVFLAAKWNFITIVTGISHERLQVFHRWTAWLMFVLALIHTFPFIVYHIKQGDMVDQWKTQVFYWTGVAALIPQAWLTFMSIGPIRNRFYETFKTFHYVAAALFIVFLFIHCDFRLSSWDYFIALVIVYGLSLCGGAIKAYVLNGFQHRATLEPQTDGTVKMTILTHISWKPGQHMFVRFVGNSLGVQHSLATHPFSICSLPYEGKIGTGINQLVFYVKPHGGITRRMQEFAKQRGGQTIPVLLDGPYGGIDSSAFDAFERFFFIAGGSGGALGQRSRISGVAEITRRAGFMGREIARRVAVKSIQDHLLTTHAESIGWFRDAVSAILSEPFPGSLRISVHVTQAALNPSPPKGDAVESTKSINVSDESLPQKEDFLSVQSTGKRPDLPALLRAATTEDTRPLAIAACGPASMLLDVRNAAAEAQVAIIADRPNTASRVWLHTENFSW
ncbi:ferric-chelate reductase [Paecilomyces variotii No. 5]|uniref:ferric-chelate reductase (NADPH) n=1 Tax=Byssochlamys spectabilis (strain No. 5 / NBRC 109023) TaxID=1356009 RepID=V5FY42_BYSSN|nr:ferric-chelate reductase [Paecilomyces variotii No. 5]